MGAPAEALLWKLRAATSLARLWHQHPKPKEADKLLASVYNRFTESLDNRSQDGCVLLDQFRLPEKSYPATIGDFSGCLKRRSGSRFTEIPEA
jgi:hypothetical protein